MILWSWWCSVILVKMDWINISLVRLGKCMCYRCIGMMSVWKIWWRVIGRFCFIVWWVMRKKWLKLKWRIDLCFCVWMMCNWLRSWRWWVSVIECFLYMCGVMVDLGKLFGVKCVKWMWFVFCMDIDWSWLRVCGVWLCFVYLMVLMEIFLIEVFVFLMGVIVNEFMVIDIVVEFGVVVIKG